MKQAVKTVTLDPRVWGNGNLIWKSRLLGKYGGRRRQCCIGVACTALGVPDKAIRFVPTVDDMQHEHPSLAIPLALEALVRANDSDVYGINDSEDPKYRRHANRVKAINADLEKHKIPLRFRLKTAKRK